MRYTDGFQITELYIWLPEILHSLVNFDHLTRFSTLGYSVLLRQSLLSPKTASDDAADI